MSGQALHPYSTTARVLPPASPPAALLFARIFFGSENGHKGNLQYLVAWRGFTAEDSTWTSAINIETTAPKRIADYWTRRKVVQEYDQRVKTSDDLAVFAMMGTEDKAQSPMPEIVFSEDSLLVVGEDWAEWAGASSHPMMRGEVTIS